MRALLLAVLLALVVPGAAFAQDTYSTTTSPPVAADTVPPAEAVTGTPGSQPTYRRGDAIQPRITRATSCTLSAAGTCSVTWDTALALAPTIVTTPVNPGAAQAIMCNTTVTPTTTGAAIKCWTIQNTSLTLAIITVGLSLVPATVAPAGTVVQIIAIPPTQ